MERKKTMTLNLTSREMDVLEELSRRKELTKTAVMRQALRLYQIIAERLEEGEKIVFEDELGNKKSELALL